MPVALWLFLALSSQLVFSYNIDTSHAIISEDPEPTESGNYFGYTVALSYRKNPFPVSNLFVGAPRYSNGTGKVYRCSIRTGTNIESISSCRGLEISQASAPKDITVTDNLGVTVILHINKTGWLGATMATGESSNLTVCAPYSLINSQRRGYLYHYFLDDMRGYCFDVPNAVGDTLYRDNHILATEIRYPNNKLINSMYGFSMNYAVKKGSYDIDSRIVGQPRLDKVQIKRGKMISSGPYVVDELSNLGYSVSSGYYFDSTELIFAAGAPGWMRKGRVMIIPTNYGLNKDISGTVLGEYFGASLTTGDFDGDGFDDLAVGAPHFGEVDFGRVYTFYGNIENRKFESGLMLQGNVEYGQFGYTLASADLDNDKYSDLVVSAPWEGSGVLYIYYGSQNFRMRYSSAGISQRIEPSKFMSHLTVRRFGFALSDPVDIDGNGYPDLAIGAYKSGQVVVLRGRPVIKTKLTLTANPHVLPPASGQSFVVTICLKYNGEKAPSTQEFQFQMAIDEVHRRVEGGSFSNFTMLCENNKKCYRNETIKLAAENENIVDQIPIRVRHNVIDKVADGDKFCKSCPVLSKEGVKEFEETIVHFKTGCQNSTNGTICNARLSVDASFGGVKDNNEWVVGSGDISLNIVVSNAGDPAYQTQLTIALPATIRLRNEEPSCKSNIIEDAITLICEIGNPLLKGHSKNLNIVLDMESVEKSDKGQTKLLFKITRFTRSEDRGKNENPITLNLFVKNQAWISVTGLADRESQDYSLAENKSTVPIRHSYQVLKVGGTPIRKAKLFVDVPVAMAGKNYAFLNISNPQFTDSTGESSQCLIQGDKSLMGLVDSLTLNHPDLQRRRREISDATNSSITTEEPEDDEKLKDDNSGGVVTTDSHITDRIMYLNCTTVDVLCVQIVCEFSLLKTSNDSGNMILDTVFNASAFYTSNEDSLTVKLTTTASVRIIIPNLLDPTFIQRSKTTAAVSTMLYNIPEPQKLAGWIYPVSIVFGILLLCLLVFILFKVGFFNRPKKEKTAMAKEREMILKVGGNTDGDDENYS